MILENKKYYYAENEYFIKHKNGIYFVDFMYDEKIIEFYGTIFHADKRFYKHDDNPNPFDENLKSKDIWDNDKRRINTIKEKGYKTLIIWEYDYLSDPIETIKKCKEFLYGEKNN